MSDDSKYREPIDDGVKAPITSRDRDEEGVYVSDNASTIDATTYAYSEDRKIGVTGAVFLILNKMIGTGSRSSRFQPHPYSICAIGLANPPVSFSPPHLHPITAHR